MLMRVTAPSWSLGLSGSLSPRLNISSTRSIYSRDNSAALEPMGRRLSSIAGFRLRSWRWWRPQTSGYSQPAETTDQAGAHSGTLAALSCPLPLGVSPTGAREVKGSQTTAPDLNFAGSCYVRVCLKWASLSDKFWLL